MAFEEPSSVDLLAYERQGRVEEGYTQLERARDRVTAGTVGPWSHAIACSLVRGGASLALACTLPIAGLAQRPIRLNPAQVAEANELKRLVDEVAGGRLPGGDAWVRWNTHFLRGADGKTYVPFTLSIEEAPHNFDELAVYVRLTEPHADPGRRGLRADVPADLPAAGQVPVSVPERQFARGAPTAGEASAMLTVMEQALTARRYVFEDLHFTRTRPMGGGAARHVRRAFAVAPGVYDAYIAVRERSTGGRSPKSVVLKSTIEVPDFSANQLLMSSIILTERIDALPRALGADQQVEHPYALGPVELVPAADSEFDAGEALSLAFVVYNPALDATRSTHVVVDYRFYSGTDAPGRFFRQTEPHVFTRETAGAIDPKNRQFPVSAVIPLTVFPAGDYRLEITVQDRVAATSVASNLAFTVR
jgi:hypothetical protein